MPEAAQKKQTRVALKRERARAELENCLCYAPKALRVVEVDPRVECPFLDGEMSICQHPDSTGKGVTWFLRCDSDCPLEDHPVLVRAKP